MNLLATDIYNLQRPSRCGLRVYLIAKGEPAAPPGDLDLKLREMGIAHEKEHLETLGEYVQPVGATLEAKAADTRRLVDKLAPVIYQPVLMADATGELAGNRIVGVPDLLILQGGEYRIRDVKLARQVGNGHHPEIVAQVGVYGWLFQQSFGVPAAALEVAVGDGSVTELPDDDGAAALQQLAEIQHFRSLPEEPYEPVGLGKCGGCGYRERCWEPALARNDVATLPGVDQGMARALHGEGVETVEQLLERFDAATLSDFKRPWGQRTQRVGTAATAIIARAEARRTGAVVPLARFEVEDSPNYVVFDIEGLPPYADEGTTAYLWGIQVFGEDGGDFTPAVAGFDAEGDRQGWMDFLANCRAVFERYGDIPFLHWASYEKTRINEYVARYGDPDGTAARVLGCLTDLYTLTPKAFALPIPSYSLKAVEALAGYERSMDDYGGDWSIVQYLKAQESDDPAERQAIIDEIALYNREDLEATWAVFAWLRTLPSVA